MKIYQGPKRSVPVNEAVLHCLAVPTGWYRGKTAADAADIVGKWHKARGFARIGYHFLVMPDGSFADGRPLHDIGAHCIGKNVGTLGIALCERRKIDSVREFNDYFTEEQAATVRRLLASYEIAKVTGHNDHAAKLCPGFQVRNNRFIPD